MWNAGKQYGMAYGNLYIQQYEVDDFILQELEWDFKQSITVW